MSTSVPSERVFSSSGRIITKTRSRLKGDIVEAIQVLKATKREDLFTPLPCSRLEDKIQAEEDRDELLNDQAEKEAPTLELDEDCELPGGEVDDFSQL
jgi:hypothetical protein